MKGILVYFIYSMLIFSFLSLLEDTRAWFCRLQKIDFVLKLLQMILNDPVLNLFDPVLL